MNIWRSIFGWEALFRWYTLGAVVPGLFIAAGLGMWSVDWFPHNLLISQLSFALAAFLFVVKIVGHAIESKDGVWRRVIFAVVMCCVALGIASYVDVNIQSHKNKPIDVVFAPKAPSGPDVALTEPKPIPQIAIDSRCSNIGSIVGSQVDCSSTGGSNDKKKSINH